MKRISYSSKNKYQNLSKEEMYNLMFDLINAFGIVRTPLESANLIQDLLTESEIKNLAKRLRIAKLILNGVNQRDVSKKLHCGISTVSKVNIWLTEGGEGLRNVIAKLPKKYALPKNLPPIPLEFQLPQLLIGLAQYSLARPQEKMINKFSKKIKDKKNSDAKLQKEFDSYYRSRKS